MKNWFSRVIRKLSDFLRIGIQESIYWVGEAGFHYASIAFALDFIELILF
ncbi:hypothetical protein [Leptospira noguchii]|uniref:Uncharacterized protein n=1 Tax=Leptospira noguchii TaxID=28182 RepID=A0AAE9KBQ0_9LEPT|nr:hypothetical protein [Leptospira noguchii]EMI69292.1 hypothetical protein LEP1GSC072_1336 [Leptospira noguchii str. Bonito]EMS89831.1 hypothetical protein LEP1GSC073_0972 [Leptospira noguchii str. Cascata]UOG31864.1 hypothetical protein MAL06_07710 [Leptospira noguchii]UOG35476.1 hypothetical protein MAL02_07245 [Leptospira noguchii]UOG46397.1 hypothetical protein MAL01_07395 [Leptospira noguchii]